MDEVKPDGTTTDAQRITDSGNQGICCLIQGVNARLPLIDLGNWSAGSRL